MSCDGLAGELNSAEGPEQYRAADVQHHSTAWCWQQRWPSFSWTPAHLRHVGVQHVGVRLLLHRGKRRRGRIGAQTAEDHWVYVVVHLHEFAQAAVFCRRADSEYHESTASGMPRRHALAGTR